MTQKIQILFVNVKIPCSDVFHGRGQWFAWILKSLGVKWSLKQTKSLLKSSTSMGDSMVC